VTEWLDEQPFEWFEKWPPCSPDLNLIENLWSIIKQRLAGKKCSTYEELASAVEGEWANVDHSDLRPLYESMPRRIAAVIEAKGGPTRY
jgi:hypothetical protein